ncbi:hypothetical protein [Fodinicola feengrottensis]|uniref:hypothetical protein n=1 Tax=Fodinicola feengrottensis TaxID=435914 RepID=UPI002441EC80|nr:hypothetical protein [Fodinicola feengrottensis]
MHQHPASVRFGEHRRQHFGAFHAGNLDPVLGAIGEPLGTARQVPGIGARQPDASQEFARTLHSPFSLFEISNDD